MLGRDLLQNAFGLLRPEYLFGVTRWELLENFNVLYLIINAQLALSVLVIDSLALRTLLERLRHSEHCIETRLFVADHTVCVKPLLQISIVSLVGEQVCTLAADHAHDLPQVIE